MRNDSLREYLFEALHGLDLSAQPRFGGLHLYLDGTFFGFLSSEGRLYFRTDEESRGAYTGRGMTAFQPPNRPRGPRTVDRNFEVPADVVDDPMMLREWAVRAAQAAT